MSSSQLRYPPLGEGRVFPLGFKLEFQAAALTAGEFVNGRGDYAGNAANRDDCDDCGPKSKIPMLPPLPDHHKGRVFPLGRKLFGTSSPTLSLQGQGGRAAPGLPLLLGTTARPGCPF